MAGTEVTPIPIDSSYGHEDDSTYDDTTSESDTTTLASEITKYRFENDRRYHAYRDGEYWGPNDEQAANALDIAHHLFLMMLDNKLFLAPIDKHAQKIIDIGTGTGIWAVECADEYPSAQVIGTDLSPIQPAFVPPNCQFEIDDCCQDWTYANDSFEFVHIRVMLGSVADWPAFYKQAYDHIKPGGYIEQLEVGIYYYSDDNSIGKDDVISRWGPTFDEAAKKFGKSLTIQSTMADDIKKAGFEDVKVKQYKLPVGPWSSDKHMKDVGRWHQLHCEESIEGWALALLTRVLGWTFTEAQLFIAGMRKDIRDRKKHTYQLTSIVYGRKPLGKTKS